jgi:hypothetical protein
MLFFLFKLKILQNDIFYLFIVLDSIEIKLKHNSFMYNKKNITFMKKETTQ